MSAILGLNAFHPDSSACLVIDGKLHGAVAEERLGARNKHTMAFPENAIRWLLQDAGIKLADITHIALAHASGANIKSKVAYALSNPKVGVEAAARFLNRQKETAITLKSLPYICDEDPAKMKYKIYNVEHHLAHIASAYYLSGFDGSAGFSYDGSGDFASAMAARCEGPEIKILDRVRVPDSLGHFYSAMCQLIGFDLFGEEYKVMGLAPYGEDTFAEEMHKIVSIENLDWFRLDRSYFTIHRALSEAQLGDDGQMKLGRLFSEKVVRLLGDQRDRQLEISQREKNIAKSTQVHFERAASNCLKTLEKHVPLKNLSMAGGCALNGVMNARMYRDFDIDKMYLQCAASDDGTAIGAAYACWHMGLGRAERFHMKHGFWGPEYSQARISKAAEASGYQVYECQNDDEAISISADYIAKGAVLGWYQGRSEWGPRALGNRSILANPAIKGMKDTINKKIKKRESFRPFAPSVLREEVGRFFEQDIESPFMMHVVKFKPEWRELFPAVTHVDGTGRLQSVDEENNPKYYKLIRALKDRTGYGIVLNTSFNENEPVVDTPEQAIACFDRTDMDVLVLGTSILWKPTYTREIR
ncbi:carbamoyltransferase family protein [Kordiimonas pumila]|uniref:Carbamoyltransferase n=1 Tax=Kordiimonas pumila TaxID=2161677 RepID=A0ABV7D552_9PROT|nr:carbamoyltransferase C-terminal domain-containing protein [Kordiimonas pumila]